MFLLWTETKMWGESNIDGDISSRSFRSAHWEPFWINRQEGGIFHLLEEKVNTFVSNQTVLVFFWGLSNVLHGVRLKVFVLFLRALRHWSWGSVDAFLQFCPAIPHVIAYGISTKLWDCPWRHKPFSQLHLWTCHPGRAWNMLCPNIFRHAASGKHVQCDSKFRVITRGC